MEVLPSRSFATGRPPEPLGFAGGGSPIRPLTPSQFAERLHSTTPANLATSICHSSRACVDRPPCPESSWYWYDLQFYCVICGKSTTDWILAQLNSSRDCVCRSCAPRWHGFTHKSKLPVSVPVSRDPAAVSTVSAGARRRGYILRSLTPSLALVTRTIFPTGPFEGRK